MLIVIVSWIIICFVLFSLGDIFLCIYNKLCKSNERYSLLDTVLLGMCFITLLVSISSIWLPSNHFVLLAYVIISILYWIINRKRLQKSISFLKENVPPGFITSIGLISLLVAFYLSFLSDSFDSDFYHHQHIRWNEEYPVIPGLANLEDRFGFNSSYLLISAIFSFRFLFGEAIYTVQSLLYILFLSWVIFNLIKSGFNMMYVVATIFMIIIFLIGDTLLDNTSTDIIPIICIFYYILKTVLTPNWVVKQSLLAYILPIALVTFKLSSAIFCITSIAILIYYIVQKENRKTIFFLIVSLCLMLFWCIRNIIITGYVVYPISTIDIFSFDWKIPLATLDLQKEHIHEWALLMFKKNFDLYVFLDEFNSYKLLAINRLMGWTVFLFLVLSPITIIYSIVKKKAVHIHIYVIYLITVLCLLINMMSAPDFRFLYGYIYGGAYIHAYLILNQTKFSLLKAGNVILIITVFAFCFICFKKRIILGSYIYSHDKEKFMSALIRPVSHPRSYESDKQFDEYRMGDITIYITKESNGRTFDILPATNPTGLPFTPFEGGKIQSIKTIENRGHLIEDGLRTKREYIDTLNNNKEKYKEEYLKLFKEKVYKK